MALLKPIETIRSGLETIPVKTGQVIYCTDTNDTYVDSDESGRVHMTDIIRLKNESERELLLVPLVGKIYLVEDTSTLYKYNGVEWETLSMDIILEEYNADTVRPLTPGTLEKKGVAYAPRTLASVVYMDDGAKVSDVIQDMIADGKRFILQTVTEQAEAETDGQRIFRIPAPLENYNFAKFPLMISLNGVIVNSINYAINDLQLIFKEDFALTIKKHDVVMFIFHYIDIITEDTGLNAESVNNVRFYVDKLEPIHKKTTDVWFDIENSEVKRFNGTEWEVIVSGQGGGNTTAVVKGTTELITNSNSVNINVAEGFDKNLDILFVYQNSIYLEVNEDYTISDKGDKIICINGTWNGVEDPQVFNFVVFKNVPSTSKIINGSFIVDDTITEEKLSQSVRAKLNSSGGGSSGPAYVHPTTHPASMIDESTTRRFVSDEDIFKWNNMEDKIRALESRLNELENSAIYSPLITDEGLMLMSSDGKIICVG